ncbi:MAG: dephospho-CoA kinase [Proteobacteria bacterium]|nr:dephospho-CoA kinase [Pseudomonadota bacterium]MDA1331081.1 dephospho-CoA kinase [Pseudomonadota bacterium]
MLERLIIGLTGGIGSGKSAVSDGFERLGIEVIDTDKISHQLTMTDTDALQTIADHFGANIIQDRVLNRKKLREIIFSDKAARSHLEQILHPRIRQKVEGALSKASGPYIIIVVPLLVEKGQYTFINRVLVVDCEESVQIERVKKRSSLTDVEVNTIIRTQATRQARLALADDIITNNDDLSSLLKQVQVMHEKYIQLSSGSGSS